MNNTKKTADGSPTATSAATRKAPKRPASGKTPDSKTTSIASKPRQSRSGSMSKSESAAYPEPEMVGGHEPLGKTRKRHHNRRRKGENIANVQQQPLQHPAVDPDELISRAWKIFRGEVTEEGLALMDDQTAAEAARRAFRVAELFLIEASTHRPDSTQ